ncbi:MAG: hypothetical protein ACP5J4_04085 [Anaerolineae bacterium]
MSSREFDGMLDDLVRQALYPFAEAKPPVRVWRRVLRAVRSMRTGSEASIDHPLLVALKAFAGLLAPAGLAASAGFTAAFSRFWGSLSGMSGSNVMYVSLFSNRAYCVDQNGHCLSAPFLDITLTQMFDLRLAS